MTNRIAIIALASFVSTAAFAHDAKPSRWCGWYARHNLVSSDPGKEFNAACEWEHYGHRAYAPGNGIIVVWCSRHHRHVGKIVGDCNGTRCPIKSGNDGHAVRTRWRDVSGATLRTSG